MQKLEQLYEGKAKKVFKTDNPDEFIIEYKDDATAGDGAKKGTIAGKGVINNEMTSILFPMIEKAGIPTHFIEKLSPTEQLVKVVTILPLEVIVRNTAAGSISQRLGIPEGTKFDEPTLEFSYKNDDYHDPLINDDHAVAMKLATREEIAQVRDMTMKLNEFLKDFFAQRGVDLIDFKVEYGKDNYGNIILADEISPDTCRFWDIETGEKLDKDRFRRDLGNIEEAYQEMLKRVEN
jgi:phosphoribosylaminoimidazole-succinocarboxamide synthase